MTSDAPWTEDEVASLNAYQACPWTHPFTGERTAEGEQVDLIATQEGWVEVAGGPVVQTWAHKWMTNWGWQRVGLCPKPERL